MPAFPKLYTDSGHSSEVAHTTNLSTTTNGAVSAGGTSLTLTSTTGWPTSGVIDIIDGTNGNETIEYYGLSGTTIQLAKALQFLHPTGTTVNQWYYQLAVGDQTNGIPNDGTNATPVGTNTATWYIYNAGDQVCQGLVVSTVSGAPSTGQGYTDTLLSITSASTGFSTSVTVGNLSVGGQQQLWVTEEVPSGQSNLSPNANPQYCQIQFTFSTI